MFVLELFENDESEVSNKPMTVGMRPNAAVNWINSRASEYMKRRADGATIFRGMHPTNSSAVQYGDAFKFKRVSANTMNFYTKFFATSPNWEDFPSREHAFICGSTESLATGYGRLFTVIPADDAKIGICPDDDIWRSFHHLKNSTQIKSLSTLNVFVQTASKYFRSYPDIENIEKIRDFMKSWTREDMAKMGDDHKIKESMAEYAAEIAHSMKPGQTFEEFLEQQLDPKANGFTHTTGAQYDHSASGRGQEIWISGEALFVRLDALKDGTQIQQVFAENGINL